MIKKIDIHVHSRKEMKGALVAGVQRLNGGGTYATPNELRKMYDQIGVEKGVLLPSNTPECAHLIVTNEDAYEITQQYPETLPYWFCNINPKIGGNSPDTDLSYFLNFYKSLGARGVGEVTSNLYFDDPLVENLFRHCELCELPLTFHIGNPGYGDYGLIDDIGLPRLERALQKFPKLQFLGHSQKFWAEIGQITPEERNGYPSGPIKSEGRVVELMRKYPNLTGDLSAGSGYNAVSRDPDFGYAFIEEFSERLYFGTDICTPKNITNPMLKLSAWLDEAAEKGYISRNAYEKVCRENALKLLDGKY
jgi:predicted TIM-barrel fold metal-dependent hydrolase